MVARPVKSLVAFVLKALVSLLVMLAAKIVTITTHVTESWSESNTSTVDDADIVGATPTHDDGAAEYEPHPSKNVPGESVDAEDSDRSSSSARCNGVNNSSPREQFFPSLIHEHEVSSSFYYV